MDILDLKGYGPENIRENSYIMVVFDNFSKIGWRIPSKNEYGQIKRDSFKNILKTSKSTPNLPETDDDGEFVNKFFTNFLNKNSIKRYSRNTSFGVVFVKRFNRTFRDLLKKPVFGKCEGNWIDVLSVITKQYSNHVLT